MFADNVEQTTASLTIVCLYRCFDIALHCYHHKNTQTPASAPLSQKAPLLPPHSSQQPSDQVQRQQLLPRSRSAEKAVGNIKTVLSGDASDLKDLEYALPTAAWNALMLLHSTMNEVSGSHSGSSSRSRSDSSIQSMGSSSNSISNSGTSHNDASDDSNVGSKIGGTVESAGGITAAETDSTSNAAEAVVFAESQPEHGPSGFLSAAWKSMFNLIDHFLTAQ
eukprot:1410-Heterococcus_DN1.PRE.4